MNVENFLLFLSFGYLSFVNTLIKSFAYFSIGVSLLTDLCDSFDYICIEKIFFHTVTYFLFPSGDF